jgi:nitronate monooxygenase
MPQQLWSPSSRVLERMGDSVKPLDRASRFCATYGLELPIMLAPMAGACPASLSIAVANAGRS